MFFMSELKLVAFSYRGEMQIFKNIATTPTAAVAPNVCPSRFMRK